MRPRQWLLSWDDAGAAVDTAFTLLVLVVFIIGIFEFVFGYWVLNSVQLAVEEGGRYAIAHRACPPLLLANTSVYPQCQPAGTLPPGTCLDPTTSQVSPTVQQIVYSALPGGSTLFDPDPTTAVSITKSAGGLCPNPTPKNPCANPGEGPLCPATLGISVSYQNSFLNTMFPYGGLVGIDNVPMD